MNGWGTALSIDHAYFDITGGPERWRSRGRGLRDRHPMLFEKSGAERDCKTLRVLIKKLLADDGRQAKAE